MKKNAAYILRILIFSAFLISSVGCALFSSDEEPAQKNTKLQFEDPDMPYRKIDVSNADSVWQSNDTGNTIAINSSCKKDDANLKTLEDNILAGVDHLKNRTSK